jgi:hypothetical protein
MKLEQEDGLGAGGFLDPPRRCSFGGLQRPEIVGQMENPSLEAVRRLWWRAFDRVCYWMLFIRLSTYDRIFGPELPTPADLKREADHERLVRVFPVAGETVEPIKLMPGRNRDLGFGSPLSDSADPLPSLSAPSTH